MMKRGTYLLLIVVFTLLPLAAFAGDLDSPGDPTSGSGMYTLEEIYQRLLNGSAGSIDGACWPACRSCRPTNVCGGRVTR